MMRFKRVAVVAMVLALAAGTAFAQPLTRSKKPQQKEYKTGQDANVSRSLSYDALEIEGYFGNPTLVQITLTDDPDSEPIVLDRSFREALKENSDKETMERIAK
ncbi:MAG: hypothetical protein FWC23_08565 [Chitinispirillia bacterium]|nr:hypothetical protein [Chitinispirillia bacterium]MCL2269220.1 hypothetical protein [Chitinispirillia bacterium]